MSGLILVLEREDKDIGIGHFNIYDSDKISKRDVKALKAQKAKLSCSGGGIL